MSDLSRFAKKFASNAKGSAVDKFAILCALISITCVLGARGIDKMAQSGSLPEISIPHATARYPGVDYTATASIPGRAAATSLNPCGQNTPAH